MEFLRRIVRESCATQRNRRFGNIEPDVAWVRSELELSSVSTSELDHVRNVMLFDESVEGLGFEFGVDAGGTLT